MRREFFPVDGAKDDEPVSGTGRSTRHAAGQGDFVEETGLFAYVSEAGVIEPEAR